MATTTRHTSACIAAFLVVAVVAYFLMRTPQAETLPVATAGQRAADMGLEVAPAIDPDEDPAIEVRRRVVVKKTSDSDPAVVGSHVLRVVLEGLAEESARTAQVSLEAFDSSEHRTSKTRDSWPSQGLTSEFDLDPFFAALAERNEDMRADELKVHAKHLLHFRETVHVPLASGVKQSNGQTVYEVRVRFADAVYWPEFKLEVRDKHTRKHLEEVELRYVSTAYMGMWQQPEATSPYTALGTGLDSPIALLGGRKKNGPEDRAAGIAVRPPIGEAPRPTEIPNPAENGRGIMMYARAPGYAWGRIVLDVSKDATRELLLEPGTTMSVRFANVQLDRYQAIDKPATLCIGRIEADGSLSGVYFHQLDEKVAAEGLRVDNLLPGEHTVSVELGHAFTWRKRHVLAREKVLLAAGNQHEVTLVLATPPGPPQLANLSGTLSFPIFGGEKDVRLGLYQADYKYGEPDFELSLADMQSVGGALPTWAFRFEELPVGRYQARLMPFERNWMIELPAGGRDDVELAIPDLAEVLVETIDLRTGELVPLEQIFFSCYEDLQDRIHHEWSSQRKTVRYEVRPGRFRFWTAPGPAFVRTYAIPDELNIGYRSMDLELVPGLQSVRFELAPACSIHFEFRVDGDALPIEDGIYWAMRRRIRAVGHDGQLGPAGYSLYEASAPGLYEIDFEGIGADRFHPIPSRRVEVREGEVTEVVVELRRKLTDESIEKKTVRRKHTG